MSNSAISYYAVNGKGSWDKKYKIRAVVTLAPNVGLFITKADQGISTLADLKGKRVAIGPSGAGFEMFLMPLMNEHGVLWEDGKQDFTPVNANYSEAVSLLGDGNVEAAFMGGAIPTPAVSQACTTMDVHFIQLDQAIVDNLVNDYPFYEPVSIPAGIYPDLDGEFQALNVGSMQLITSADQPDELIYEITKTIWKNREAIAKQHPAAKAINKNNAARFTGTPFHPGAIKFYKEEGIWKEPATGGSE
jgi:TRAP transporter TAXI family solute receptor